MRGAAEPNTGLNLPQRTEPNGFAWRWRICNSFAMAFTRACLDRRRFAALGIFGMVASSLVARPFAAQSANASPRCARTPLQTAGPFHVRGAPFRDDFRVDSMEGEDLTVHGRVMSVDCQPVAGAVLDVWQADPTGRYDNQDFRLRGKVRTDADGAYKFQTLKPGAYGAGFVRTPHIHVRITAEGMRQITTQVYFPGEELNAQDAFYREDLLLSMSGVYEGMSANFQFVLEPF